MEIHNLIRQRAASSKRQASVRILLAAGCSLLAVFSMAAVPDGYVVKIDSATLYLDWGSATGVLPGSQFSVYRPGSDLKHPVTGEILGKTEQQLGSGMIERVEDKFSIGRFLSGGKGVKEGDRTHLEVPIPSSPPAVLPVSNAPVVSSTAAPSNLPQEFWRSEPLKIVATGITLADIDGDGKKEIVVASRDTIEVFRWTDRRLEPLTSYKHKSYRHWVAVAAGDLNRQGRDDIFASAYFDAVRRPHVVVLRWINSKLEAQADFEGYVRAIDRAEGSRTLAWQNMGRSREASFTSPAELIYESNAYRPGPSLKLSRVRDNELFGYTLGDWDGDRAEDLALLQGAERLRVFLKDLKWSASENYGGTKNDLSLEDDKKISVSPRLVTLRGTGRDQLMAVHNIPELGIRLTHLKLYKKAEISVLAWNGLDMAPLWRLPVDGYVADYDLGDGLQNGSRQLWVAAINRGDKTVLLCYTLP